MTFLLSDASHKPWIMPDTMEYWDWDSVLASWQFVPFTPYGYHSAVLFSGWHPYVYYSGWVASIERSRCCGSFTVSADLSTCRLTHVAVAI
jgi:hypothetical protein